MEMNFPHKSLATDVSAEAAFEAAETNAHRALLAHAIARQSLSYSSRNFVAHRNERSETLQGLRGQGLDNRIRFFAGQLSPGKETADQKELFVRGHFRPDIAAQFFAKDSA